jgi:hypothetical protein
VASEWGWDKPLSCGLDHGLQLRRLENQSWAWRRSCYWKTGVELMGGDRVVASTGRRLPFGAGRAGFTGLRR